MTTRHPYLDPPPYGLAHRGGYRAGEDDARENTLRAFAAAVAAGIDHLETDVHATRDGVLVALHDDRLDRVTDGAGAVADLDWETVSRARIAGEPVPRFADLLSALPTARVNVDLKAPGAVAPLVAVLAATGAGPRTCVGSFSDARLWRFRILAARAGLRVPTSAGPLGVAALRFLPGPWWRWLHTPGIAYQVPVTHRVLGVEVTVVTTAFVDRAHALGRQVHVWTIDDPAAMDALFDLGVDAIVSDRVDTLLDVLARRR
ncbi:glycerophosphodiester phosphodiesterase family protein [Agilicoccus flavus]|uniref:glycerophosphodiester phosphodiesterase family protein n=1 Tax=Agilicoccus flavus TaxID=2775968 RepID=UPI001CF6EFC1|nr:glycerophosphodiester phosphodiesterase family protein [Agilicoccus flavus]